MYSKLEKECFIRIRIRIWVYCQVSFYIQGICWYLVLTPALLIIPLFCFSLGQQCHYAHRFLSLQPFKFKVNHWPGVRLTVGWLCLYSSWWWSFGMRWSKTGLILLRWSISVVGLTRLQHRNRFTDLCNLSIVVYYQALTCTLYIPKVILFTRGEERKGQIWKIQGRRWHYEDFFAYAQENKIMKKCFVLCSLSKEEIRRIQQLLI